MDARVTLFEIDTVRVSLSEALNVFKFRVLPRLRQQPGCEGVLVLDTPEGKGILISFWRDSESADLAIRSGFYDAQVAEFTMFLRQPPDRQHYEVVLQELERVAQFQPASPP